MKALHPASFEGEGFRRRRGGAKKLINKLLLYYCSSNYLRPTKTLKAEISGGISGRKLLGPMPLESVPQFCLPPKWVKIAGFFHIRVRTQCTLIYCTAQ